jgi:hypothetical protein
MAATETLSLRVPAGFKARVRARFGRGQVNRWAVEALSRAIQPRGRPDWETHLANLPKPVNDPDAALNLRHARLG